MSKVQRVLLQGTMPRSRFPRRRVQKMKIKLEGNDVVEGFRDWFKAEIEEGPRQGYDLGKFFFTVSVGTAGVLATLEKLNATSQMDLPMIGSLLLLFLS